MASCRADPHVDTARSQILPGLNAVRVVQVAVGLVLGVQRKIGRTAAGRNGQHRAPPSLALPMSARH